MGRKNERYYRKLFFTSTNFGPYDCFFCKEFIEVTEVCVHHIDNNHENDDLANLTASHKSCHTSHHRSMMPDEERKAHSERMRNRVVSEETRQKMREAKLLRGKTGPQSEETKTKKSEAVKQHWANDPDRKIRLNRGEDGKFNVRD